MAKIDRAIGKGKVQTLAADNTNRLITEGVLRELLIDLWDSGALQIDEETFLNLQDLADRDYRVGECMVYDNGQGFKIFRATTAGVGIPFVAANWELLTSSGGTANTLYSADGVISGTRIIQLPSASTVFWNGGSENSSSVLELSSSTVKIGGQSSAFTEITGLLSLNGVIQENTSTDPVRILAYDPVNFVTKYINSNEIAGSNIYTADGELSGVRSLTGNQGRGLFQRFFDTDISTFNESLEISHEASNFRVQKLIGDGTGSPTEVIQFEITTAGINFFNSLGTGIGYGDNGSLSNVDWNDVADENKIPSIKLIKDNLGVGSNIYTSDGELTDNRSLTANGAKKLTERYYDSNISTYQSYVEIESSSLGFSAAYFVGDGSGSTTSQSNFTINSSGINFFSGNGTGIGYINDSAFQNIEWETSNRRIPCIQQIKDNTISADRLILPLSSDASIKDGSGVGKFIVHENNTGLNVISTNTEFATSDGAAYFNMDGNNAVFSFANLLPNATFDGQNWMQCSREGIHFRSEINQNGVKYNQASDYSNIDWETDNNHIPSIQLIKDNTVAVAELPYTVTPDLVTFDRDVQIPNNSLLVGDATKLSDMAQSLGYTTKFDGKEYILMGYEITENGNQRPFIKSFSDPSSFDLQPLTDDTEAFTGLITFDITSAQQVIGKTYRFNLLSDTDLTIKVFRLAEGSGADAEIVSEVIPASSTSLTGFDFDLTPLVDFEIDKVYRLEIDNGTGNGQVQGTIISGPNPYSVSTLNVNPNFVPYLKRQTGWVYEKKAIGYQDEGLSGLYPVFISSNESLSLDDRLVICQPVFVGADIELTLPDIQVANDNKYFVEVYNGSENDSFDVIVKDNTGNPLFTVKSRERMLYFPLGNSWESIVLSTQVFTDDSIDGTGAFSDPLSRPKLYAHVGVTNDAPIQNNTVVPLLIDTWDLNIPSDGLYNVHVTVEYNINVANRDAIFRFDVNGATGIEINQEAKDATNNIFFTTFAFDTLQAGNNTIEFYASIENPQGANRVEIRSNRYTAQKIDVLS